MDNFNPVKELESLFEAFDLEHNLTLLGIELDNNEIQVKENPFMIAS